MSQPRRTRSTESYSSRRTRPRQRRPRHQADRKPSDHYTADLTARLKNMAICTPSCLAFGLGLVVGGLP